MSAGKLVMPKLSVETKNDEQGPSGSRKNAERDDEEEEDRQPEEPIEQDPDPAGEDDDKASLGCASSLDSIFLDEDEIGTETLTGTTERAEDEPSNLDSPSAFMNLSHNLPESSSPGKTKATASKFLMESPPRCTIEGAGSSWNKFRYPR